MTDPQTYLQTLTRRYDTDAAALIAVLCPLLIPIEALDKTIIKLAGQSHWRASFTIKLDATNRGIVMRGRTGKFVPSNYGCGQPGWKEIAKGRIIDVDYAAGLAHGEVYVGGTREKLSQALEELSQSDYLEIDQYGAAAKVLSGLAEYYLVTNLEAKSYEISRMPEDMAKHLGGYTNYDFLVRKNGQERKIEVKSLWGTNTNFARLIHSTTTKPAGSETSWTDQQKANYYPTSSCKFSTQDIFAVSLFLRTGNIRDFAFARSVPSDIATYGLPRATDFPDHVNQNPTCNIGDGKWFATVEEVWDLP